MDITEQQQELIDRGDVSQVASQMLIEAMNGETAVDAETGRVPATTQQTEPTPTTTTNPIEQSQPEQQVDESQLNRDNAVISAKDGKHTIPFERLQDARKGEQEWKQRFEESQAQLQQLQAEAQQRADSGQTVTVQDQQVAMAQQAIDAGTDPDIFGDFSEEALAKGINTMIDQRVAQMVEQRVHQALAPMHQQQQKSAEQSHFETIFTKHPDAESIVESQEFGSWMQTQPSFVRSAYDAVLSQGTAEQVVELLDLYKGGITQSADLKAVAMQAVKNAPTHVPLSVTDFPSGNGQGQSNNERLANLSGPELLLEMQNWTPEQVDAYYERNA